MYECQHRGSDQISLFYVNDGCELRRRFRRGQHPRQQRVDCQMRTGSASLRRHSLTERMVCINGWEKWNFMLPQIATGKTVRDGTAMRCT